MPRWCVGTGCREQAARAASGPVIRLGPVSGLPEVGGIVVPVPASWI